MKKAFLKDRKEEAVERFHPWVFSGAIARWSEEPADGEIVAVHSQKGRFLGIGHFQRGSIMVRLFSFQEKEIDAHFWREKVQNAWTYRQLLHLSGNCFRLVHAEGDGLPGLIVDVYNRTAVIQCHSVGMHLVRHELATAIAEALDGRIEAVYDKSAETLPPRYAEGVTNGYLLGESPGFAEVLENGHLFRVNWVEGQKTGFFLDQRENRQLVARYAAGKSVVNAFSYSGGFSVYALKAGATEVISIDSSAKAIELATINAGLNGFGPDRHQAVSEDVLQWFRAQDRQYDILVVDPPAFAKTLDKRHNAVQGYKRLNAAALQLVKPGGMLFTFSCSQVVDRELFYNTLVAAALEAGRQVRVMQHLGQPPDHPVQLFHPEGGYLKGLALHVL